MEDVSRAPADVSPVQNEPATIPTLDGWIESLMKCKQLAEADVQRLCEKVRELQLPIRGADAAAHRDAMMMPFDAGRSNVARCFLQRARHRCPPTLA